MPFEIVRNDIAHMRVDAIVNAAHHLPKVGAGVDSALHQKAGPALLAARQEIGVIPYGSAAVTPAFALDAKYVIHAATPIWMDGEQGELQLLRQTYDVCLELALQHGCESVAFPLLASGNHGFPKAKALQTAISAFSEFLMEHDIHDRADIRKIEPMTERDYYVRGSTALLDAVGKAIRHIGNVHKYAREEDRPEKTLFVITTDGMENASREYSYERVRRMIEHQKEKYGWEFLFLGANIDAAKEAARFGIGADYSANYHADRQGTAVIFEAMSEAVCSARAARPMSAGWKKRVDEDYKKRGGR